MKLNKIISKDRYKMIIKQSQKDFVIKFTKKENTINQPGLLWQLHVFVSKLLPADDSLFSCSHFSSEHGTAARRTGSRMLPYVGLWRNKYIYDSHSLTNTTGLSYLPNFNHKAQHCALRQMKSCAAKQEITIKM